MTNITLNSQNAHKITLFYDGACPLCLWEITHLKEWDTNDAVQFVDLASAEVSENFPDLDIADAQAVLLAINHRGEALRGIDATLAVWQAVGKGRWVAPLSWRLTRPAAKAAYGVFAKHRLFIAGLLARVFPLPKCQQSCQR